MSIKWLASKYRPFIKRVEIVRETDRCVWVATRGEARKEAKESSYGNYFDTFQQAKLHLIIEAKTRIKNLEIDIADELKRISMFEKMQEPSP